MRLYDEYFREMGMLVIAAIVAMILIGCGPAVRDPEVYSAEVDFMEAAAAEQVERGIAVIDEYCTCEEVLGVKGFTTESCNNLAETILVVKHRMKYHTEFMRYLGGIHAKRPPKEPSEVPDPSSLCPNGGGGAAPVEDVEDYPVDAGVDGGE